MTENAVAEVAGATCFVIGPIGDRLAPSGTEERKRYEDAGELWEYVIQPACAAHKLDPIRADKIAHPGEITEQIFRLLRDADVVIADLTGGNPNVMYELGLRHTRDKITIQLGENERLPFDINTIRTIRFRRTEHGLVEARDLLIEILGAGLSGGSSPVTATRVWHEVPTGEDLVAAARRDTERHDLEMTGDSEDEAPGFIDTLAEGEAALSVIGEAVAAAGALIAEIGKLSEQAGRDTAEADARGAGFAGRLVVARQFASNWLPLVERLEEAAANYSELMAQVDPMMDYVIGQVEADPEQLEDSREFLVAMVWLAETALESMESQSGLAVTYRDSGKIAKDIRPVAKRAERALRRMIDATQVMGRWKERVEALDCWRPEDVSAFRSQIEESSEGASADLN